MLQPGYECTFFSAVAGKIPMGSQILRRYLFPPTAGFHWFLVLIGRGYRFLWRNREYSLDGIGRISGS